MRYPLLSKIQAPSDLQHFSCEQMVELSQEIRQRIIDVMAVNGGHLASNLGSVELSLALHLVFNSPQDKFIFDVSHQTYTHKLITGRNNEGFDKIRCSGGLNGFSHPEESSHDHFYCGHAGTALSLALGMAKSRDLAGGEEHILPIIGDASLTCGLSFEALNNLTRSLKRFIVVLNDNKMSISHHVGGIRNLLSRLLNNPTTSKLVHELETIVAKIPYCGSSLAEAGQKLSGSIKNLVSSAPFFEHFGLSYIGPIDGHDLKKIVPLFQALKDLPLPVIVHLRTQKGYGLKQAENDPISFHGVKPFDPKTCEFIPSASRRLTFPNIFGKHIVELGEKNSTLVTITPAMSLGSCLDSFKEKFPDRFFDVGIAEGHAITFAGGLAKERKCKVICSIYATFLQRALDNLFHDVCLQRIPVLFAIDRAGLAAGDGATHNGIYDISFLKAMPNMVICQPRDGKLLKELLLSALSWDVPAAIRYPNMTTEEEEGSLATRTIGKAELLAEGEDILLLPLGTMCREAQVVKAILKENGISAAIVDPIFIKPLDTELLGNLLLKHDKVVTIEEHALKGGFGQEINSFILSHGFSHVQVLNCGIPDMYVEHGSYQDLLNKVGLSAEKIVQKILNQFIQNSDEDLFVCQYPEKRVF